MTKSALQSRRIGRDGSFMEGWSRLSDERRIAAYVEKKSKKASHAIA